VCRGAVVGTYGDDVFVELGPRMQGVISRRELPVEPKIGDEFDFTLRGQEQGLWVLALRETKVLDTWESMEVGSLVQAHVVRVAPGGLELKIGPLHAFLPKSQTGLPRDEAPLGLVGKNLAVEVLEVDRERQRVVVSRKVVVQRERESERQRQVGALKPGQVVQGRVTRLESYGAFVTFGRGLEGLVHVSNLSHERVEHPRDLLREGQVIDLKVLHVKAGGKKIALGLKQMTESPWQHLERIHYVDQIVEGRVSRVLDFGAFLTIEAGVEGLLPRSQMGLAPEQSVRSLLTAGQKISVRIQALDCASERLSLSLLHRNGARIGPEEAADAASFAEILRADPGRGLLTSFKNLLQRALRQPDADSA
jgi:ribosomal protein S1